MHVWFGVLDALVAYLPGIGRQSSYGRRVSQFTKCPSHAPFLPMRKLSVFQ